MRALLVFAFAVFSTVLLAQGPGGGKKGPAAAPKNLKVLTAENVMPNMRAAAQGLGVMCNYCHVDDRSSDEKPEKVTARMMFSMTQEINAKFTDGKVHVTCFTCHRGAEMPLTAAAAQ